MCTYHHPCTGWSSTACSNANCGSMSTSGSMGPSSLRRVADLTRGSQALSARGGDEGSGIWRGTTREHSVLLERIPSVPDLQSAWLLLTHCAAAKTTSLLHVLHRPWCAGLKITTMVCGAVSVSCSNQSDIVLASATAPLILGGLGLRSAERTSVPHVGPAGPERHPEVARGVCYKIGGWSRNPMFGRCHDSCLEPGWHVRVRTTLVDRSGSRSSSSSQGARLLRARSSEIGWQHEASSRVELQFRKLQLMPALSEGDRALMRSRADLVRWLSRQRPALHSPA